MLGLGVGLGFNRVIGAPLLLDKFSGAAAAYSLRALSSTTTDVVRVRRSSDNAEQDFSPDEINDGSLATWVGAGNDGFVTTWYDQSGNSNDATQTTASQQPKIVDAGTLVTENGKAAIDFDGTDDFLALGGTSDAGLIGDISSFIVLNPNSIVARVVMATGKTATNSADNDDSQWGIYTGIEELRVEVSNGTNEVDLGTSELLDTQNLLSFINNEASNLSLYLGGILKNQAVTVIPMNDVSLPLEIGRDPSRGSLYYSGNIQESILYPAEQSANRTAIETNINNHYSIY